MYARTHVRQQEYRRAACAYTAADASRCGRVSAPEVAAACSAIAAEETGLTRRTARMYVISWCGGVR